MIDIKDDEWNTSFKIAESPKDVEKVVTEIKESLKPGSLIAFDFETNNVAGDKEGGVKPFVDNIYSVSFCVDNSITYAFKLMPDGKWDYSDFVVDEVKSLFEELFNPDYIKILHNLKFDAKLVYRLVGKCPDVNDLSWYDTMVMSYLMDENRTVKLKTVAGRYLHLDSSKYENMLASAGSINKINQMDWFVAGQYNCADSWLTRELYKVLLTRLQDEGLEPLYNGLYKGMLNTLLETEIVGFCVDKEYLSEKGKGIKVNLDELFKKMGGLAEKDDFNPRSVVQVRNVLERLELTQYITKKTKTGATSTDQETLESIVKKDDSGFVETLLTYRKDEKTRTFVDGMLDRTVTLEFEGNDIHIIRSNFLVHGTVTGRLSSRDPNFQNLPRGRILRWAFQSRPGKSLVIADFSQLELRVTAFYSQDPTMLEVFARNGDIHARTAIVCFNLDCEEKGVKKKYPEERNKSKGINFGVLYDLSARSLAKHIDSTEEEAEGFIQNYYEEFSKVGAYKEKIKKQAIETGEVVNLFGRKRRFPGLKEAYDKYGEQDKEVGYKLREAFNALIQGTGVDICNLTIVKIKRKALEEGFDIKLLAQVHDEMIWEVDDEHAERLVDISNEVAENIIEDFKTPIDPQIFKRWGENYDE